MTRKTIESYDDYIDDMMENCTYNSYDKIQSCGAYSIGDVCKINVDWAPELKRKKVKLIGIQKNGNKLFAQVKFSDLSLYKKYGSLFSLDELVRI